LSLEFFTCHIFPLGDGSIEECPELLIHVWK
jgi:hypothetical protein